MTENPWEADPDLSHRMDALAGVVRSELVAAGLPLGPHADTAGAVVEVERPYLRGVLVGWREGIVLLDAAQEALGDDPHHEGEECAAFSRLTSAISEAMVEAMRAILTAAGLEVTRDAEDLSPHDLLVTRRLAPSPWRARRDAAFEARHDKMREAWNKRNAERCPNPDCEVHGPLREQ
ncbi:hypothetical protein AB0C38_37020 [Amycolatopsis sp. NPDC048633]|uniref:hypothetical protein n=1 Tax=Amycolatopsis sp. NPDC048633 TaxID=3157095 RepID=UPI0034110AC0